jgi:pyridoxine 5'-phosphate synthase PdxJ
LLVLPLAPLLPAAAAADDIELKSTLVRVTVFPAGAEAVREAGLELAAGDHVIVVRDLPEHLVDSSLRVEGEADQALDIGSVDSKRIFIATGGKDDVLNQTERKKIEDEIEKMQDEKALMEARVAAAQTQRRLM